MLDEVLGERHGVGNELVGHDVGVPPAALVEGVFGGRRPHGRVPHRQGELLVSEGPGTVERVRRAQRQANQSRLLCPRGSPVHRNRSRRAPRMKSAPPSMSSTAALPTVTGSVLPSMAIISTCLTKQPALIIEGLDGDLRSPVAGRVQGSLVPGQAQRCAKGDGVPQGIAPAGQSQGANRCQYCKETGSHGVPPLVLVARSKLN